MRVLFLILLVAAFAAACSPSKSSPSPGVAVSSGTHIEVYDGKRWACTAVAGYDGTVVDCEAIGDK